MKNKSPTRTIGIDPGDRKHAVCVLDANGEILTQESITYPSTYFAGPPARCQLTPEERQLLFGSFLPVAEWVQDYYLRRPNLSDEGGNDWIELAVTGAGESIVTNNLRVLRQGEPRFPKL